MSLDAALKYIYNRKRPFVIFKKSGSLHLSTVNIMTGTTRTNLKSFLTNL